MSGIESRLEAEFGRADPEHFTWQTEHAFVGVSERELVRTAFRDLGERILDVGCGEGATLLHLGEPPGAVGVDLFAEKLAFARERLQNCRFVRGSAYTLPFEDAFFDDVLVRDVLHHLESPGRALAEMRRVVRPGGRVHLLEPCRYNPLVVAHAATNRAERGELRSTQSLLCRIAAGAGLVVDRVERFQALPLHRVVFHPRFGVPSLGRWAFARSAVGFAERVAARVIPRAAWAYILVRAHRATLASP